MVLVGGCHSGSRPPASPAAVTTRATQPGPASEARGTIDVDDQESNGTTFVINAVAIDGSPNGGWVTIYRDDNGQPGPLVASIHIPPTTTRHLTASLATKQSTGRYWVVLRVDAGRPDVYEPKVDVPVLSGTDVIMQQISLIVK
jgi:hypothetical protein